MLRTGCASVLLAVLAGCQSFAFAQAFPTRPVRVVVPYAPGAAADATARISAAALSELWKQPVLVDNRPGGNSVIGTVLVTQAEADGYTLLFASGDTFTTIPHLLPNLQYDPLKDLVPINIMAKITVLVLAGSSVPADSLPALIAYARANPRALSYGSPGSGGSAHLTMEMLKSLAKFDMLHVPYKGVAPATAALVAGEVQVMTNGYGTSRGQIAAGRIKALAVTGSDRLPQLPNLPTTAELGYGEVDATIWWGMAAPARTPADVVNRINESISRVLSNPETGRLIEARGLTITNLGPKAFAERLAREHASRGAQVRMLGIKAD